jgi:hypothetical protein
MTLLAYVLTAMTFLLPAEAKWEARYDVIAESVVAASSDRQADSLLDSRGMALLLLEMSWEESGGWRERVHTGQLRGDDGLAWCLLQLHKHPVIAPSPRRLVGAGRGATGRCFAAGASYLAFHLARCGSVSGAVHGYATGWACRPASYENGARIERRVGRWRKLRSQVESWEASTSSRGLEE